MIRQTNPALIIISISFAWPFLCLEETSFWITLLCFLVWDFFAVGCFIGPFWLVVRRRRQRSTCTTEMHHLPSGLFVIVGRAFMRCNALAFNGGLGVLIGLSGTVVWSIDESGSFVPALPVACFSFLLCYLAARFLTFPAMGLSFLVLL